MTEHEKKAIISMNDKREIKALINKQTGKVVPIPESSRPTISAYKNFKRPLYQALTSKQVQRRDNIDKKGSEPTLLPEQRSGDVAKSTGSRKK